jgi:iron complex transport system ATP-binding protein
MDAAPPGSNGFSATAAEAVHAVPGGGALAAADAVFAARALSVELGGREVVAGVSLSVGRGGWLMLIGPNGAGKSTVLRALVGLLAYRGSATLHGRDVRSVPRRELARCVAFVPQNPQLPAEMSVWEYAALGRTPHLGYLGRRGHGDEQAVQASLERLDLTDMASRRLGTLSGGERQRVVLARALAQEADVLLLDEPTAALDVGRQQDVLELVRELRARRALTVIGALHDLTLAGQYADRLLLLDHGRIAAAGPATEVLRRPLLERHYRARLQVGAPAEHGLIVTPCPPQGSPAAQGVPAEHDPSATSYPRSQSAP